MDNGDNSRATRCRVRVKGCALQMMIIFEEDGFGVDNASVTVG